MQSTSETVGGAEGSDPRRYDGEINVLDEMFPDKAAHRARLSGDSTHGWQTEEWARSRYRGAPTKDAAAMIDYDIKQMGPGGEKLLEGVKSQMHVRAAADAEREEGLRAARINVANAVRP
jgi:hypothetical protein